MGSWGLTLEHVQHPLGNHEATRDVTESKKDGQRTEDLRQRLWEVPAAKNEHAADTNHAYRSSAHRTLQHPTSNRIHS